jgi:Cu2+-containing amine oxidase
VTASAELRETAEYLFRRLDIRTDGERTCVVQTAVSRPETQASPNLLNLTETEGRTLVQHLNRILKAQDTDTTRQLNGDAA